MKSSVNQIIPAGLLDDSFELFSVDDEQYCVAHGRVWTFPNFPIWILRVIILDMDKYPKKIETLRKAGFKDLRNQMKWYIHCCFGGFDGTPDYVDGVLVHIEYFDCGQRGNCPYENDLCSTILHQHGITSRQTEFIKLIHQGLQDKEIADELNISPKTAPGQVSKIIKKLMVSNRSDVVRFAGDHQIIHQINI